MKEEVYQLFILIEIILIKQVHQSKSVCEWIK